MSNQITFADFTRLLQSLGFRRYHAPNPAWVFENAEHDALIALPEYKENEFVRSHHLISARGLLDERGLMASEKFNAITLNGAEPSEEVAQDQPVSGVGA
jgi:hypothetical protein